MQAKNSLQPLLTLTETSARDLLQQYGSTAELCSVPTVAGDSATPLMNAQIIIAGAELELAFRVRFHLPVAQQLAAIRLGLSLGSQKLALDFMREYTNVVSGQIKAAVEAAGIALAQGLPFVYAGGKDGVVSQGEQDQQYCHQFGIKLSAAPAAAARVKAMPESILHCILDVESKAPTVLSRLAKLGAAAGASSGKLELF